MSHPGKAAGPTPLTPAIEIAAPHISAPMAGTYTGSLLILQSSVSLGRTGHAGLVIYRASRSQLHYIMYMPSRRRLARNRNPPDENPPKLHVHVESHYRLSYLSSTVRYSKRSHPVFPVVPVILAYSA